MNAQRYNRFINNVSTIVLLYRRPILQQQYRSIGTQYDNPNKHFDDNSWYNDSTSNSSNSNSNSSSSSSTTGRVDRRYENDNKYNMQQQQPSQSHQQQHQQQQQPFIWQEPSGRIRKILDQIRFNDRKISVNIKERALPKVMDIIQRIRTSSSATVTRITMIHDTYYDCHKLLQTIRNHVQQQLLCRYSNLTEDQIQLLQRPHRKYTYPKFHNNNNNNRKNNYNNDNNNHTRIYNHDNSNTHMNEHMNEQYNNHNDAATNTGMYPTDNNDNGKKQG